MNFNYNICQAEIISTHTQLNDKPNQHPQTEDNCKYKKASENTRPQSQPQMEKTLNIRQP